MKILKINYNCKKGFSLIEVSVVILVVGILIAGISEAVDFYRFSKLTQARNLTKNSRVSRIDDLIAWYETTLENTFSAGTTTFKDVKNIENEFKINRWKDNKLINNFNRRDATQTTSSNQPKIVFDNKTSLPIVDFVFSSSQFLNLPNGTVPYNDSPYTVIFVSRVNDLASRVVLSSGNFNVANASNTFRYDSGGKIVNYWWNKDIYSTAIVKANQLNIFTFTYDQVNRKLYIDGKLNNTLASSLRASTELTNYIGRHWSSYMNGQIGEIIIYERAINDSERIDIENYLAKKWDIKLAT
jgi:prepilin-type N-terminal cleavage/methylation domain-containing protein